MKDHAWLAPGSKWMGLGEVGNHRGTVNHLVSERKAKWAAGQKALLSRVVRDVSASERPDQGALP